MDVELCANGTHQVVFAGHEHVGIGKLQHVQGTVTKNGVVQTANDIALYKVAVQLTVPSALC